MYSTVHELFAFPPHASYRCLLCACVYVCCALCVLLLCTWNRSSWGYVAAMATDKAMLRELMEQDENFINPLYIHLAQRLLHGLLYVLHSCPLPPSSIDGVCAEVQLSVIVIIVISRLSWLLLSPLPWLWWKLCAGRRRRALRRIAGASQPLWATWAG